MEPICNSKLRYDVFQLLIAKSLIVAEKRLWCHFDWKQSFLSLSHMSKKPSEIAIVFWWDVSTFASTFSFITTFNLAWWPQQKITYALGVVNLKQLCDQVAFSIDSAPMVTDQRRIFFLSPHYLQNLKLEVVTTPDTYGSFTLGYYLITRQRGLQNNCGPMLSIL